MTAPATPQPGLLTDRQQRVLFAIGALDLRWCGGELHDEFVDERLDPDDVDAARELERLGLAHVNDRTRAVPTETGLELMRRIVPDRAPWRVIIRTRLRQPLHPSRQGPEHDIGWVS